MVIIVNYGVGNLASIQNMFKKAGIQSKISDLSEEIEQADKILLPGMGNFDNCIDLLNISGLRDIVERKIHKDKIPVLGICVGVQMFMRFSEEGILPGLGWIKGDVIRFKSEAMKPAQRIPNIGWLEICNTRNSPLLDNLANARFYFAHSYHVKVDDEDEIMATASYGYDFTVGVEKGNILGVQFHPEKSHRFGMQLLRNFALNF